MTQRRAVGGSWPDLPYPAWRETCTTLHLWTQIVGKIRLSQTPWLNHSWHVALYVNRRLGSIGEVMESGELDAYASLCSRTLARAHARTGDPVVLAGYMGKSEVLDDALTSFAMAYAAQTKHDHARLEGCPSPQGNLLQNA